MAHHRWLPGGIAGTVAAIASSCGRNVIGVQAEDARSTNHIAPTVAGGTGQGGDHGMVHIGRLECSQGLVATITLYNPSRYVGAGLYFSAANTSVTGSTAPGRIGRVGIKGSGPSGGGKVAGVAGRAGDNVDCRFTKPGTGRGHMRPIVTDRTSGGHCNCMVHRCRLP